LVCIAVDIALGGIVQPWQHLVKEVDLLAFVTISRRKLGDPDRAATTITVGLLDVVLEISSVPPLIVPVDGDEVNFAARAAVYELLHPHQALAVVVVVGDCRSAEFDLRVLVG
jgi:hypothetical protein